jgi:short-subunit dehydrogenase
MGAMATALITGASSGIGYELAKLFAADGHDLILVARRKERLDALAEELIREHGVSVDVVPTDLSRPAAAETLFNALGERPVDYLVNNAGFGNYGPITDISLERERDLLQVNLISLVELTKLYLPRMKARGAGRILNVASTAAFQPGPGMANYFAGKAYVLSFSEAVDAEMKPHGVRCSCLCPGVTRTEFLDTASMGSSKLVRAGVMDVEPVARAGYRGLMRGKRVIIPGWRNRFLTLITKFAPRRMATWVCGRLIAMEK